MGGARVADCGNIEADTLMKEAPCNPTCSNHEILRRLETAICGDAQMGVLSLHERMDQIGVRVGVVEAEQDVQRDRITRMEGNQARVAAVGAAGGTVLGAVIAWAVEHWPFTK